MIKIYGKIQIKKKKKIHIKTRCQKELTITFLICMLPGAHGVATRTSLAKDSTQKKNRDEIFPKIKT